MQVNVACRVFDLLQHAARFRGEFAGEDATISPSWQLCGGPIPANANVSPGGGTVLLASGNLAAEDVTTDVNTLQLTLSRLVDSGVDTDGTPTFFRLLDDKGSALFSAAMIGSGIDAEVIVTVEDQPGATGVIRYHTFSLDLSMQF